LLSVSLGVDVNAIPRSTTALGNLVELGGRLVFTHDDGRSGAELYVSDGTEAGTRLLKDILPGSGGSSPASLASINDDTLYFAASDGQTGRELWVSDGTSAGTRRLADLNPGSGGSTPYGFTPTPDGTGVYFFATSSGSTADYKLYRTDGTGTVALKALYGNYGYLPSNPVLYNGALYFIVAGTTAGGELWTSDGTAAGTRRVQTFVGNNPVKDLTVAGDRMFLTTGYKNVYVTDGSDNGATLLATIGNGGTFSGGVNTGGIANVRAVGGTIFFSVNDTVNGIELWAADPTHAWLVKDIYTGSFGSSPNNLVAHNGRLYFAASDIAHGNELWTSDGTEGGTYMVKDLRSDVPGLGSSPTNLASAGGRLWFGATGLAPDGFNRSGLWTSDGTPENTIFVKAIAGPASNRAAAFTLAGDNVFFTAGDNTVGAELWRTSATAPSADNTAVVRDVYRATDNALPRFIGTFKDRLYYFANDGVSGAEPWYSDGTPGGSGMLKNINAGSNSSIGQFGSSTGAATSQYLFFPAQDGNTTGGSYELWRTDATGGGTIKLRNFGSMINSWAVINDRVYFTCDSNSTLFTSDGTPNGTVSVTSNFGFLYETLNNVMYTVRSDAVYGEELWRSDGTAQGTYRVTDVNPGAGSSNIDGVTVVGNSLFFFAVDATGGTSKLYKYTPATGATTFVKDVLPDRDDYVYGTLGSAGGKFFFSAKDYSTFGEELYVSDGTADGTHLVKDILPGSGDSRPSDLIEIDGAVVFKAGSYGGEYLWRSDGTAEGTYAIAEINPEGSSIIGRTAFVRLDNYVYLGANASGFQGVWRTDGTRAGTQLVSTVDPGGTGYSGQFAPLAGRLLFSGDDGLSGHEVWQYVPDAPPLMVQSATFDPAAGGVLRFDMGRPLSLDLARAAVTVTNVGTGVALKPTEVLTGIDDATGQLVVTFPSYPRGLPDGNYRVTLPPGAAMDTAGNPLAASFTFDFFVLAADANRDRKVDFNDLVVLAQNYNTAGKTFAEGDFNNDTKADFEDLVLLAQRYNTTLPEPPAGAAAVSVELKSPKSLFSTAAVIKPLVAKPMPTKRPSKR
jgi:ELWxxDGT repeat protein